MPFGDYEKLRVIGTGSYGQIWLVKSHSDKRQYVIKEISFSNKSKREQKSATKEVQLFSDLKHPNIVLYKESFAVDGGKLHIVMDFCSGGDLYTILRARKNKYLEEKQVVEWSIQIALALRYLHGKNILHRDLKTQNIFLSKSQIIKLGDFGISRMLDSASDMATTVIGTPYYMSPELFSNKPYSYKSDMWSFGCCMYEMLSLRHAFDASSMQSLVFKILRGKFPPLPKEYSSQLVDLVKSTLDLSPENRPSISRFLSTTYIRQNIQKLLDSIKKRSMGNRIKNFISSSTSSSSEIKSSSDDRSSRVLLPSKEIYVKRPPTPHEETERSMSARERRRARQSECENLSSSDQSEGKPVLIQKQPIPIPKYAFLDSLRINRKRMMIKKEANDAKKVVLRSDKPLFQRKTSDFENSEGSDTSDQPNVEIEKLAVCLGNTLQAVEKFTEDQKPRPPLLPCGRSQSFRHIRSPKNSFPEQVGGCARLEETITSLKKECIECFGEELFEKVMNIISVYFNDEIENKLVDLLGREKTNKHIKLINTLKFCYEMSN